MVPVSSVDGVESEVSGIGDISPNVPPKVSLDSPGQSVW